MLYVVTQRLSHRLNGVKPDGPFEDIPPHLRHVVGNWFQAATGQITNRPLRAAAMRELCVLFRMNIPAEYGIERLYPVFEAMLDNEELALDLVDATLGVLGAEKNDWEILERHLTAGASAWKVADDHASLTRVVNEGAQATYDAAVAVADAATTELHEAWANAFGRNGDPSDAWDHAIKAVEDVLVPVVVPNKPKATLGDVLGQLGSAQSAPLWEMILPGNDQSHDVAPLVAMLRLMWPNHDRHGGNLPKRTPSTEEARAVVTLAAMIVQWHREGWVVRKR